MNAYAFRNSNFETRKESEKLAAKLATLLADNEPRLSFKLKMDIIFIIKKAGVSGVKKMTTRVSKFLLAGAYSRDDMALMVVCGNTYNCGVSLKNEGFNLFKIGDEWIYALEINKAYYENFETKVLSIDEDLFVCKSETHDLTKIVERLKNIKVMDRQEKEDDSSPIDHYLTGEILEMTKWYGRIIKEDMGLKCAFRNIKIINVYKETEKALLVDFELFSGIGSSCGVCGRSLDNEISKACGIGPVCAVKYGLDRPTKENAKEIVLQMEKASKEKGMACKKWIPKSQIKS